MTTKLCSISDDVSSLVALILNIELMVVVLFFNVYFYIMSNLKFKVIYLYLILRMTLFKGLHLTRSSQIQTWIEEEQQKILFYFVVLSFVLSIVELSNCTYLQHTIM